MRAHVLVEDVSTGTRDPLTGETIPLEAYRGPARFRSYEAAESDFESAGASMADQSATLIIPWDAPAILTGNRVTCVTDPDNPRNAGATFRVEARLIASQISGQRYRISEVTS